MKSLVALASLLAVFGVTLGCSKSSAPVNAPAAEQPAPAASVATGEPAAEVSKDFQGREKLAKMISDGKFAAAEQELAAAIEQFPDDWRLHFYHENFASALEAADRNDEAFAHRQTLVDAIIPMAAREVQYQPLFAEQLNNLIALAERIGGSERADTALDRVAKSAQAVGGAPDALLAALTARRAVVWANSGRVDGVRKLLTDALDRANAAGRDAPDPTRAALGRAHLLLARTTVEAAAEDGAIDSAWTELIDDLFASDAANPDDRMIRARLFELASFRAARLVNRDVDRAESLLNRLAEIEEFNVDPVDDKSLDSPMFMLRRYGGWGSHSKMLGLRISVAEARRRIAQYGTPAQFPDNADRWVNADEPLTADDLRGKVVLLDFFAVWCGPCIATFPHLSEWREKYADQGFEIIGVSEYHGYGWNGSLGYSQRKDDITPDEERDGFAEFAAHHKLLYPIALTPDNALQQHYFVNGIPHAVLIDRAGKVRLYRIGSGEENARDLEQAIEECLQEPVAAPSA